MQTSNFAPNTLKKKARMITILKGPRAKKLKVKENKISRNVAVFYAVTKRKELIKSVPFSESAQLFGQLTKQYSQMPLKEREKYRTMWLREKVKKLSEATRNDCLKKRNTLDNPNYQLLTCMFLSLLSHEQYEYPI